MRDFKGLVAGVRDLEKFGAISAEVWVVEEVREMTHLRLANAAPGR